MTMESELTGRLTFLNECGRPPVQVEMLAGDASTRTYFRATYGDGTTAAIMVQPEAGKGLEASFLDVHRFLEGLDLPVPRVYCHVPAQGVLVLQDLGDDLLEIVVDRSDNHRIRSLYFEAVDLLLRMRRKTQGTSSQCAAFSLAFDEAKLMEELEFFLTHFVKGLCAISPSHHAESDLRSFFSTISKILAAEPRIFTHRDYHSRNLIHFQDRLHMIDFQDARMGPAQYDLASLLRDSYVTLPQPLVDELIDHYCTETEESCSDRFRYVFDIMSLQRNIKALGTFGYQISVRRSLRYGSSIPRTGAYIADTMGRRPELQAFRSIVEDWVWRPAIEFDTSESNSQK